MASFSRLALGGAAAVLMTGTAAGNPLTDMPDASGPGGRERMQEWARSLPAFGETQFTGTSRMPSPEYWGDLSIYQVFPDRFNNGDSSNDFANLRQFQTDQTASGNLERLHTFRHGGDIRGMIDRLDYIESTGAEIFFPTSFFFNNEGQFHGYCVSNLLEVDPNFGTLADFQELVQKAHARGIRVVMDFVINHLCDLSTVYDRYPDKDEHNECVDALWNIEDTCSSEEDFINRNNGFVPGRANLIFGETMFKPLKRQEYFSRCGVSIFYSGADTFPDAKYSDFVVEMLDLQLGHPDVQLALTEMAKYWIAAADVDGFRLDAAKHVADAFLPYFSSEVRDYALSLGKDNFYVIGEVVQGPWWQARIAGNIAGDDNGGNLLRNNRNKQVIAATQPVWSAHPKSPFPGTNGVYDFAHSGATKDVARGDNPYRIQQTLEDSQRGVLAKSADVGQFFIHVDIHDWRRLLADGQPMGVALSAFSYLFTARGIPIVYYGTEQGFSGTCDPDLANIPIDAGTEEARQKQLGVCRAKEGVLGDEGVLDPDAVYRQTMWVGGGYALGMVEFERQQALAGISKPEQIENIYKANNWREDPYLQDNPILATVRRGNWIRKGCTALRRGDQWIRWGDQDGRGLLVSSRLYKDQEIITFVNFRNEWRNDLPEVWADYNVAMDARSRGKPNKYVNLLNPDQTAFVVQVEGGGFKLRSNTVTAIGPYSVVIWVREDFVDSDGWCDYHQALRCNDREPEEPSRVAPQSPSTDEDKLETPGAAPSAPVVAGASAGAIAVFAAAAALFVRRRRQAADSSAAPPVASVVDVSSAPHSGEP